MKCSKLCLAVLLGAVLIFGAAGCGNTRDTDAPPQTEVTENQKENSLVPAGRAFIYVPDDNAEGWDINQVEIAQVTADALIGQLVGAGVLTDSITVQNFQETEEEGQYVLKLDLSSNFKDSVRSMGTAGEILTIGAVVNSFLDTFQAEAIQITVDGGTLETGHEIYEGYMTHMDNQ